MHVPSWKDYSVQYNVALFTRHPIARINPARSRKKMLAFNCQVYNDINNNGCDIRKWSSIIPITFTDDFARVVINFLLPSNVPVCLTGDSESLIYCPIAPNWISLSAILAAQERHPLRVYTNPITLFDDRCRWGISVLWAVQTKNVAVCDKAPFLQQFIPSVMHFSCSIDKEWSNLCWLRLAIGLLMLYSLIVASLLQEDTGQEVVLASHQHHSVHYQSWIRSRWTLV